VGPLKEDISESSLSSPSWHSDKRPCEDTARRQPSASLEKSSHQKPNTARP